MTSTENIHIESQKTRLSNEFWSNIWLYTVIITVIKLIFVSFSQTVDADAASRSLLSATWLENPKIITEGIWAPFHFYLGGLALWIYYDIILSLKLVSIVLSSLTLPPLFFFLRREFDAKKAFIGVLIFSLSPILFRVSFMFLSEIPFIFFVVLSFNFFSKGTHNNHLFSFLISGLFMTIASGFRFESWPIILFLCFSLLANKNWKGFLLFGLSSAVFPLYWMYGNYLNHGSLLHSIEAVKILLPGDLEGVLRKIWSFPFILLIAIGPIFALSLVKNLNLKKEELKNTWVLLFLFFFALILYKSLSGTIIPHTRFICLITLLALPLILRTNNWLSKITDKPLYLWSTLILTVGLTFIYNFDGIRPIPRLKNQSTVEIVELIKPSVSKSSIVFIDFIDWETTYFLALQLHNSATNFIIIDGEMSEDDKLKIFNQKLKDSKKQIWILRNDHKNWLSTVYAYETIFESEDLIIINKHD